MQVDGLFDLLKELIQDSEGAPSIDEVPYVWWDGHVSLLVVCSQQTSLSGIAWLYRVMRHWTGWWQLDEEDFKEEQNLVARLVHMLVNDDNEQMFQVRDQNVTHSLEIQMTRLHEFSGSLELCCRAEIWEGYAALEKLRDGEGILLDGLGCRFYQLQGISLVRAVQNGCHSLFHLWYFLLW
jgi:hypothetical protein